MPLADATGVTVADALGGGVASAAFFGSGAFLTGSGAFLTGCGLASGLGASSFALTGAGVFFLATTGVGLASLTFSATGSDLVAVLALTSAGLLTLAWVVESAPAV